MVHLGRSGRWTRARAFAPGHLTGFFVPEVAARDPRARGSTGAGLVLDRGVIVEARYDPEGPTALRLRGHPRVPLPISRAVAQRMRAGIPGTLEVELRHDLPIGQGLGMSAAGAVATGLATAQVLRLPEARAWETAHLAELFHQGGLGGVAAIHGGGLEQRIRPGIPPWGVVRHRPEIAPVYLYRAGPPIPSPSILSDPRRLARIRALGRRSASTFARRPTLPRFLEEAERFTDGAGLSTPAVRQTVHDLRQEGFRAGQAMFGQVVFAVPPDPKGRSPRRTAPGVRRLPGVHIGRTGAHAVDPG